MISASCNLPSGGDLDQLTRHVADALLHLRLAALPRDAAELVQRGTLLVAAVTRQHLDIFHRQEQLFVAVVDQAQTIMRRAGDRQRRQPIVTADAVFLMHDQVALGDFGRLGDELIGPHAPPRRARNPLAQQVLLADQRQPVGDETTLHAQRDQRYRPRFLPPDRCPIVLLGDILETVLLQQTESAVRASRGSRPR